MLLFVSFNFLQLLLLLLLLYWLQFVNLDYELYMPYLSLLVFVGFVIVVVDRTSLKLKCFTTIWEIFEKIIHTLLFLGPAHLIHYWQVCQHFFLDATLHISIVDAIVAVVYSVCHHNWYRRRHRPHHCHCGAVFSYA